jgi:hypothetical protein
MCNQFYAILLLLIVLLAPFDTNILLKPLFHPDGCSIIDILQNPEGHGQFVWYKDDKISIDGEKEHILYHDGHGVDANIAYTFDCPTLHRMHFLFKAYTCFHFIKFIQRASIILTVDHLPRME